MRLAALSEQSAGHRREGEFGVTGTHPVRLRDRSPQGSLALMSDRTYDRARCAQALAMAAWRDSNAAVLAHITSGGWSPPPPCAAGRAAFTASQSPHAIHRAALS